MFLRLRWRSMSIAHYTSTGNAFSNINSGEWTKDRSIRWNKWLKTLLIGSSVHIYAIWEPLPTLLVFSILPAYSYIFVWYFLFDSALFLQRSLQLISFKLFFRCLDKCAIRDSHCSILIRNLNLFWLYLARRFNTFHICHNPELI